MFFYYSCSFFFKDTASSYIYTYLPPLSLHSSLPISHRLRVPGAPCARTMDRRFKRNGSRGACRLTAPLPRDAWLDTGYAVVGGCARSEEHTSELQSLMRISYAVFCLKKQKITSKQTPNRNKAHK